MRDRRYGSQGRRFCGSCGLNGHKTGQCEAEAAFRVRLAAEVARLAAVAAKAAEAKAEAKAETDKGGG